MPSLLDASRDLPTPESKHKSKLKQERDLKSVPVQILANTLTSNSSLSTSDSPSLVRTTSAFRNSFFFNLVSLRFRPISAQVIYFLFLCLCVQFIMIVIALVCVAA